MRELIGHEAHLVGGGSSAGFNQCMAENWVENTVVGAIGGAIATAFTGPGALLGGIVGGSTGTGVFCGLKSIFN